MANSYYDATGYIVVKKVTPVIESLFSHLNLDQKAGGLEPGQVYIGDIAEDSDSQWSNVIEALTTELAPTLKIDLDGTEEAAAVLEKIAAYFKVNPLAFRTDCIEDIDFDEEAGYEQLYKLAEYFDDGHGLSKLLMQGCWHSDRAPLGGFGGNCILVTPNGTFKTGTSSATEAAEKLNALLGSNKLEEAADQLLEEIRLKLVCINVVEKRKLLATVLKNKIAKVVTL